MPTASALDQILNIVIPIAAFGFFGFLIYKAFGPQLATFWEWLSGMFQKKEEPASPGSGGNGYSNYYGGSRKRAQTWYPGDVNYQ